MTYSEYLKRVEELKKKNVKVGSFDFKGQKPIEFLKIDIFEVTVDRDAFHWQPKWENVNNKWKKTEKIVDWDKNFVLMLGGLCGIESEHSRSEKMSKFSYLSKATLYRRLPSGKKEYESAEYEFDAEIRADEVILKNEIAYMEYEQKKEAGQLKQNDREVKQKYKTEFEKKLVAVEMAKFGRQRADTGAHKRAIGKMIKLPPAKEDLIGTVFFCFQCVPDFSNTNVRNMYLTGENPASSVFGAPQITTNIEDAEHEVVEEKSAIFQITEKREALKANAPLYKLSGLVIETENHAEEFLGFLKDFNHNSDKTGSLIAWVKKFEPVDPIVESGSNEIKTQYLKDWGNK
jgi:hypothetical protein